MGLKFFLDASNANLAFMKEEDSATYDDEPHHLSVDEPQSVPQGDNIPIHSVDVSGVRSAIVSISPSDKDADYSFEVYHGKKTGYITDEMFLLDDTEYEGVSGNFSFGISVEMLDYIFVKPTLISNGNLIIEVGVNHWEEE